MRLIALNSLILLVHADSIGESIDFKKRLAAAPDVQHILFSVEHGGESYRKMVSLTRELIQSPKSGVKEPPPNPRFYRGKKQQDKFITQELRTHAGSTNWTEARPLFSAGDNGQFEWSTIPNQVTEFHGTARHFDTNGPTEPSTGHYLKEELMQALQLVLRQLKQTEIIVSGNTFLSGGESGAWEGAVTTNGYGPQEIRYHGLGANSASNYVQIHYHYDPRSNWGTSFPKTMVYRKFANGVLLQSRNYTIHEIRLATNRMAHSEFHWKSSTNGGRLTKVVYIDQTGTVQFPNRPPVPIFDR